MIEFKEGYWLSGMTADCRFLAFKVEKQEQYKEALMGGIIPVYHLVLKNPGFANMYISGYLGVPEPMPLNCSMFASINACDEEMSKSLDQGIKDMIEKKKQQASGLVLPSKDLIAIQK